MRNKTGTSAINRRKFIKKAKTDSLPSTVESKTPSVSNRMNRMQPTVVVPTDTPEEVVIVPASDTVATAGIAGVITTVAASSGVPSDIVGEDGSRYRQICQVQVSSLMIQEEWIFQK